MRCLFIVLTTDVLKTSGLGNSRVTQKGNPQDGAASGSEYYFYSGPFH